MASSPASKRKAEGIECCSHSVVLLGPSNDPTRAIMIFIDVATPSKTKVMHQNTYQSTYSFQMFHEIGHRISLQRNTMHGNQYNKVCDKNNHVSVSVVTE